MKILFAVVFFATLVLAAQAGPSDALTANPVFKKNCAKCHGKTAQGRHFGGPSLRSEKVAAASAEDLRDMIISGKGRMPKFGAKLSAAEIDQLVHEIKTSARP